MAKLALRVQALSVLALCGVIAVSCGTKEETSAGDGDGDGAGDGDIVAGSGGAALGTGGTTAGTGGTLAGTGGSVAGAGGTTTTVSACDGLGTVGGTDPLIDDLEHADASAPADVDGRTASWFTANDATNGATQTPLSTMAYPTADLGDDGVGDFAFASTADGFDDYGAQFGISLNSGTGKTCAHDVSAFTGIKFWAKAVGEDQMIDVKLPILEVIPTDRDGSCSGMGCDAAHFETITVTTAGGFHEILFSDLAQPNWSADNTYDFNPATLAQIIWSVNGVKNGGPGAFDIVIDDVEFTGGNIGVGAAPSL